MSRIKITGYIEVSDDYLDEGHHSGLTEEGYEAFVLPLTEDLGMTEVSSVLVPEEE